MEKFVEFNEQQLELIREVFESTIISSNDERTRKIGLDIIKVCQKNLGFPEYSSFQKFISGEIGKWGKPVKQDEKE